MVAADPDGGCVVWNCHKERRMPVRDHLKMIAGMYRDSPFADKVDERLYKRYFVEGRIPEARQGTLLNGVRAIIDQAAAGYREEISLYGIACQAAEKDLNLGLSRVGTWFRAVNRQGKPMIRIFAGACRKLIGELRVYSWKDVESAGTTKDGEIKGQAVRKRNDDLCDPLRYFVMDRPLLTAPVKGPAPAGSFAEAMGEKETARKARNLLGNERFQMKDYLRVIQGGYGKGW
jgi:hypothetical protein